MTTKRDPWVQVKSEDELRAGMAVQLRPCACGRRETLFIAALHDGGGPRTVRDPGGFIRTATGVMVEFLCKHHGYKQCAVDRSIREGRLFRLADDQLTDLSESRELETAR